MNKRTKDGLVAGIAIALIAFSLYYALFARTPRVELGAYEVLGAVTAEETARLVGNQGAVLVIARDTGPDKNPSVEAQLAAFSKTLKRHSGLRELTARFEATPLLMMATGGGVPPDHLGAALQKHPEAVAVVLFCGLPTLGDPEWRELKQRGVKIIVVSSFRSEYADLLERELVQLVITPRPEGPLTSATRPRTLRERFDQDYAILSAADVGR